jgi:hypothetical protein
MRLVSLLPSATEIVYALALGDQLVGVTFECDDGITKPVTPHTLRHAFITAAQMGRIASDATFPGKHESRRPAPAYGPLTRDRAELAVKRI